MSSDFDNYGSYGITITAFYHVSLFQKIHISFAAIHSIVRVLGNLVPIIQNRKDPQPVSALFVFLGKWT